jgi:hypothetical protein
MRCWCRRARRWLRQHERARDGNPLQHQLLLPPARVQSGLPRYALNSRTAAARGQPARAPRCAAAGAPPRLLPQPLLLLPLLLLPWVPAVSPWSSPPFLRWRQPARPSSPCGVACHFSLRRRRVCCPTVWARARTSRGGGCAAVARPTSPCAGSLRAVARGLRSCPAARSPSRISLWRRATRRRRRLRARRLAPALRPGEARKVWTGGQARGLL